MRFRRNYAQRTEELQQQNRETRARIAAKCEELRQHRDDLRQWMSDTETFKALRDAEPAVQCDHCRAEMRTGDWCCHCCRTPNPHHIDRGVEPPQFPSLS
jgi:hypothetical protein